MRRKTVRGVILLERERGIERFICRHFSKRNCFYLLNIINYFSFSVTDEERGKLFSIFCLERSWRNKENLKNLSFLLNYVQNFNVLVMVKLKSYFCLSEWKTEKVIANICAVQSYSVTAIVSLQLLSSAGIIFILWTWVALKNWVNTLSVIEVFEIEKKKRRTTINLKNQTFESWKKDKQ